MSTKVCDAKIALCHSIARLEAKRALVGSNRLTFAALAAERDRKVVQNFDRTGIQRKRLTKCLFRSSILSFLQRL